jgi:hypothetical protein
LKKSWMPGVAQDGDALHCELEIRHHVIPVLRQMQKPVGLGRGTFAPWLRVRLEEPDQQLARVLLEVRADVRHAQNGKTGGEAGNRLGDHVEMLRAVQRHVHARVASQMPAPEAGAVHDELRVDVAAGCRDANRPAALAADARDQYALDDARPALPRAFRQRERGIHRIAAPVFRQMDRADHALGVDQRPAPRGLVHIDHVDFEPAASRHRRAAFQFLHASCAGCKRDRAGLAKTGFLSGFVRKRAEQICAVFGELRQVVRRAQLSDQAGSVPGRAAGQRIAFEQQHVAPAELGQVIRDAATDDAPADDDYARLRRERRAARIGHVRCNRWTSARLCPQITVADNRFERRWPHAWMPLRNAFAASSDTDRTNALHSRIPPAP